MPPVNAAKVAKGEEVDGAISKAIESIDAVQNQLEDLSDQASQEILKVEQRFNALRKPHYEKRAQVISQIPNFWATVFLNHPQTSAVLNEEDEVALQSLSKVDVEEMDGDVKSGYKIAFHFAENPFFENKELTKEVNQADPEQSKATDIRWKEGKCLVKAPGGGPAGKKRKNSEEQPSFFAWFLKSTDEGYDEVGDAIKDEIWPNPLQFYLGEDDGDDDDDEGGDDEEAEEEVEEDDEDGDGDGEGAEEDEDEEEEEAEEEEDD